MRTWAASPACSLLSSALLLGSGAAFADAEVQGRIHADRGAPAVVYAEDLPAQTAPESARARMNQQHIRFVPQVLPVLQGTTVEFVNADEMAHNVFSPSPDDPFDLGSFGLGTRTHTFRVPGVHVILCNVHVEMVGWVLVLRTPTFAQVEPDGTFRLRLSRGKHHLVLWRPRQPELSREVDVPETGVVALDWAAP